jgi:hypothetical protein
MPVGDAIDDVEEASVDDDSPPPKKWTKVKLLKKSFNENKV